MTSHLARMPVSQIVTFWQPGSHAWSWAEEFPDLMVDIVEKKEA